MLQALELRHRGLGELMQDYVSEIVTVPTYAIPGGLLFPWIEERARSVRALLEMRIEVFRFAHRHNGMRVCSKNAWAELLSDVFRLFENVRAVWKQRCQNNARADLTNEAGFRNQVTCAQT